MRSKSYEISCPLNISLQYKYILFVSKCNVFLSSNENLNFHTATLRNAQLAGIGEVTGSIAPGKSADFIVTRENPLEDLRALQHLELVVCCGRAVKTPSPKRRKEVDALLDPYLV